MNVQGHERTEGLTPAGPRWWFGGRWPVEELLDTGEITVEGSPDLAVRFKSLLRNP
jgi:hypothetical protein